MTRKRSLLRAAVAATAALFSAALIWGGATQASAQESAALSQPAAAPIIVQPFAANSGDACLMGVTRGNLGWHVGPTGSRPIVDVKGVVVDRPVAPGTQTCPNDQRLTMATFTAYARGVVVDREVQRVDNAERTFAFSLTGTTVIDVVTVQVCRLSLVPPSPFEYCGPLQRYATPVS